MNPFEKRVTEYLRDDEAFLAFVTPEPLATFFEKPAQEARLYDRLTVIMGTPGSGKTTLARLFQYQTLCTLLRNRSTVTYKPLIDTLTRCGALINKQPRLLGCRLPLETEYREFWEFPYPDELKSGLMIALLQARVVLAWLRNLSSAGVPLESVEVVPRADAEASLTAIGGKEATEILTRARQIELAIYQVSAALVPPSVDELDAATATAYRPFDVIESIRIRRGEWQNNLVPLVIFDDAHTLHPNQLSSLQRWLARRELKISRWILTRLDALRPLDVLTEGRIKGTTEEPGLKPAREVTQIRLQSGEDRTNVRQAFRKMAKGMAGRYLRQMEVFNRRGLHSLTDLLSTEPEPVPPSKRDELARHIGVLQRRYAITPDRRLGMEIEIDRYLDAAATDPVGKGREDIRLAMLGILMERYANRVPQKSFFEDVDDIDPSRPLKADSAVAEGARVHLLHKYGRPYYFGIDSLCDASSENAEQFLQLAGRLVSQSETQLIRAKSPMLGSNTQNTLLQERAAEIIHEWDFPHHYHVRRLVEGMATECRRKSLEGNASLGGGASAFGIRQDEFESIPADHPELARIIQFGVAYNAFVLVPNHATKGRVWCLIELGGVVLLRYGLTLRRGGFLERRTEDLVRILSKNSAL